MQFKAYGHKNLLGTHYNTFEFTKDKNLTIKGDCIIGVNSDFNLEELKKLKGKVKLTITTDDLSEIIICEINTGFEDNKELVIRKSDYKDYRTFAINATKAAKDIDRKLIEKMKDTDAIIIIKIEEVNS
ncbi:DUF371 domain-containing protein [Candidatus Woesearchaeota archaeon]|jgi:uncharacterized protein|nr:DUF371 domain-containing protein [Candidatus Woesearchaeota archaeon]